LRIQAGKNLSSFIGKVNDEIGSFLQKPTIIKEQYLQHPNWQNHA
jgi:hypothetical protein